MGETLCIATYFEDFKLQETVKRENCNFDYFQK